MLLIEMQCKNWEHNRVNAGIIELCNRAYPTEEVKLYAEKEHIRELRTLVEKSHTQLFAEEINFMDWRMESHEHVNEYAGMLTNIIEKEKNEKKVILLSCNKGIIQAVTQVAGRYGDRKIYVILHSALEEVVQEHHYNIEERAWMFLLKTKHRLFGRKKGCAAVPSMNECVNTCKLENCFFILYAPKYKDYLNTKINQEILDRFIFLHHPLYESGEHFEPHSSRLVVGIYGQAVNQNAYDIIQTYNNKYDNGKVLFWVMARRNNAILDLKNVMRMFEQDHVSNEALEDARRQMDYVLIPYAHDQYKVTASGILSDALSEEIPVLMLDSPLFAFYHSYAIGELCHDIDSMARTIAEIAAEPERRRERAMQYRRAEHELKEIILHDNMKTFRELIG